MPFLKEPHWSKPKLLRPAPPDSGSESAEPDALQKAPATFRSKNAGRFHFAQVHRRYSADRSQWTSLDEVETASELLCVCVRLAVVEKLLADMA